MKQLTSETSKNLYTVSAVLQIFEYIYTDYLSLSIEEIRNKLEHWSMSGHQVLRSSVRIGDEFVSFNGFSDLLRIVSQYESSLGKVRTR